MTNSKAYSFHEFSKIFLIKFQQFRKSKSGQSGPELSYSGKRKYLYWWVFGRDNTIIHARLVKWLTLSHSVLHILHEDKVEADEEGGSNGLLTLVMKRRHVFDQVQRPKLTDHHERRPSLDQNIRVVFQCILIECVHVDTKSL